MRSIFVASVFTAILFIGSVEFAHAASLAGTWSGSGYMSPTSGKREKVRCQITYRRESAKIFGVVATCASSAGKVRQSGEVLKINPNRYSGDFYNSEFDVSGRVGVTLKGTKQTVTFTSSTGRGRVTLSKR